MTQKLTCEEVMSMLHTYLDDEVDGPTEADIDAHLHKCRECFSRAEFEKALRKKVATAGEVAVPDDTRDRMDSLIVAIIVVAILVMFLGGQTALPVSKRGR